MAKCTSSKQLDSIQDSEKFDLNYVHELRSRLEGIFQKVEGDVNQFHADAALDQMIDMMRRMSKDVSIPRKHRFAAMQALQEAAAEEEKNLFVALPLVAPEDWLTRKDQTQKNPFAWAHAIYGDAALFATVSELGALDRPLETAMNNFRSRKGPVDENVAIPTKRELYNKIASGLTWKNIIDAAPPRIRLMLKAYNSQRTNKSHQKKQSL